LSQQVTSEVETVFTNKLTTNLNFQMPFFFCSLTVTELKTGLWDIKGSEGQGHTHTHTHTHRHTLYKCNVLFIFYSNF